MSKGKAENGNDYVILPNNVTPNRISWNQTETGKLNTFYGNSQDGFCPENNQYPTSTPKPYGHSKTENGDTYWSRTMDGTILGGGFGGGSGSSSGGGSGGGY